MVWSFPFQFRFLGVDEQTPGVARGFDIVQALGQIVVGELFSALQFDDEGLFDEDVGEVIARRLAFAGYFEGWLRNSADTP